MTGVAPSSRSWTHRLNPFAFPSDTTSRFVLLLVAVIGVSLFAFDWVYSTVGNVRGELGAVLTCMQANGGRVVDGLDAYLGCLTDARALRLVFDALAVVVMMLVAVGMYLVGFRRLDARFEPMAAQDAPAVADTIRALASEAGLAIPPTIRWQPQNLGATAITYGPPRGRCIGITGGLVVLHGTDPEGFRAILLHELAHLRNRDVDLAHLAVAIPRAFLLVAVVPFLLTLPRSLDSPGIVFGLLWRLAILVGLIVIVRNGVLRTREHYADVRASTYEPSIRRILAGAASPRIGRLGTLLRKHPDPADRLVVVEDPARLLRLQPVDAFLVGVFGTIAYDDVSTFVGYLNVAPFTVSWLAALVFAPLVAAVVTIAAWRSAFADLALALRASNMVAIGLALGGGLLVGQVVSFLGAISDDALVLRFRLEAVDLALLIAALTGAVLFARWTYMNAAMWLPRSSVRSPRWPLAGAVLCGALLLSTAAAAFAIVAKTREAIGIIWDGMGNAIVVHDGLTVGPTAFVHLLTDPSVGIVTSEPLVVAAFIIASTVPFAWRLATSDQGPTYVAWGSLDGDPRWPTLAREAVRVRIPLLAGVFAGLAALVGLVVARLWLHGNLDDAARSSVDLSFTLTYWFRALIVGCELAAAVVVAVTIRRFPVLHSLLAVLVAGLVGTLALTLTQEVVPCVPALGISGTPGDCGAFLPDPAYFFWEHFSTVYVVGSFLSLLVAWVIAVAVGMIRRGARSTGPAAVSTESPNSTASAS